MRSYWVKLGPNPMVGTLMKRGGFGPRGTQREDRHVGLGAEIRVTLPQPRNFKDCLKIPAARKKQGKVIP